MPENRSNSHPRRSARKSHTLLRLFGRRRCLWLAALPLCQTTGCFPDLLGALNFELQALVNTVIINTINTIVANLFGL